MLNDYQINLKGRKNVEFGAKTLKECLVQTYFGINPNVLKDQDETDSVGSQRNVNLLKKRKTLSFVRNLSCVKNHSDCVTV